SRPNGAPHPQRDERPATDGSGPLARATLARRPPGGSRVGAHAPRAVGAAPPPPPVVRRRTQRQAARLQLTRGGCWSAQRATALAEATLSESTPPAIGMMTFVSAAASAARPRPGPSDPITNATFSGLVAANSSRATA